MNPNAFQKSPVEEEPAIVMAKMTHTGVSDTLVVGLTVATILTLVVTPCALVLGDSVNRLPRKLLNLLTRPFVNFRKKANQN